MNDRDIPGMGDYSPPDSPDEEKAGEDALIATMGVVTEICVDDLGQLALEEHTAYFQNIGEDPSATPFGDWEGAWYGIYAKARDAFAEGQRLGKLRKQGDKQ